MTLADGSFLAPDARVTLIDADGVKLHATAAAASHLLRDRSLNTKVRSVIPSPQDRSRRPGGHLENYYERLGQQHFDPVASKGSVFHSLRSVESLVEQAVLAGVDLSRADDTERIKDMLAGEGVPEDRVARTFRSGVRYIIVDDVLGWNGIVNAGELAGQPDADRLVVTALRAKPGVPQSFVVGGAPVLRTPESVATVVVGPDPKDPTKTRLYTTHPGLPTPTLEADPVDRYGNTVDDGSKMPLAEYLDRFRGPDAALLKVDGESASPLPEIHPLAPEGASEAGSVRERVTLQPRAAGTQQGPAFRANSAPLPQANNLGVVAAVIDAVAEGLDTTADIADAIGMADRQGAYYPNAAYTLGYVEPVAGSHPTAWKLTAAGLAFVNMSSRERAADMAAAISADMQVSVYREEGGEELEKAYLLDGLADSTARRRVSTIATWVEWADRALGGECSEEIREASEAARRRAPEVLAARAAREAAAAVPAAQMCPRCHIQLPASGHCSFC